MPQPTEASARIAPAADLALEVEQLLLQFVDLLSLLVDLCLCFIESCVMR